MTLRWKIAQWFELLWWKNYLHRREKASYTEWKKKYWANILDVVGSVDAPKTIADIGCGPAGIFIALPQNKITAVDPLIDEYEKLQTKLSFAQSGNKVSPAGGGVGGGEPRNITTFFKKTDYPNTTFINSTIEAFQPSEASKFDMVFCMNAINHVHNIQQGFEKLKNICADNGTIILSIDAHNFSLFKYLFRFIPGDILHPHQYDLDEYKSLVETDGWKVSNCRLLKKEFFFNHYLLIATSPPLPAISGMKQKGNQSQKLEHL